MVAGDDRVDREDVSGRVAADGDLGLLVELVVAPVQPGNEASPHERGPYLRSRSLRPAYGL